MSKKSKFVAIDIDKLAKLLSEDELKALIDNNTDEEEPNEQEIDDKSLDELIDSIEFEDDEYYDDEDNDEDEDYLFSGSFETWDCEESDDNSSCNYFGDTPDTDNYLPFMGNGTLNIKDKRDLGLALMLVAVIVAVAFILIEFLKIIPSLILVIISLMVIGMIIFIIEDSKKR